MAVAAAALLTPMQLGCGGGSTEKKATVETGSENGFLRSVKISPPPGSPFISKQTRFYLSWEDGTLPPPSFTVVLVRYKEASDEDPEDDIDAESSITEQRTQVVRQGTSNIWEVSRTDDFDLDQGGVYYLQLNSGPIEVLAAYIVRNDGRSTVSPTPAMEYAVQDAGSRGANRHLIVTR
jgi:hypothetical protein